MCVFPLGCVVCVFQPRVSSLSRCGITLRTYIQKVKCVHLCCFGSRGGEAGCLHCCCGFRPALAYISIRRFQILSHEVPQRTFVFFGRLSSGVRILLAVIFFRSSESRQSEALPFLLSYSIRRREGRGVVLYLGAWLDGATICTLFLCFAVGAGGCAVRTSFPPCPITGTITFASSPQRKWRGW